MNENEEVTRVVQEKYAAVAEAGLSSDHGGVRAVAEAFGYTAEQLAAIPAHANMGLSCGNPTAFASLRAGEVVVDLGCGGGLDVFLAAKRVGRAGKAIGIDMTPEMLDLAQRNAARADGGRPVANVEFHQAKIDDLPLEDSSVDCVISNCVINLAPDKKAVFREIARVLKPGGRLAVSDIALKRPLPDELEGNLMAYVGCIAGRDRGRGLPRVADRGRFPRSGGRRLAQRPERLRPGRGPVRLLSIGDGIGPAFSVRPVVLFPGVAGRRRPARAIGRPLAALQRERLCGERQGFRREAVLKAGNQA